MKEIWKRIVAILLTIIVLVSIIGLLSYVTRPTDVDQCLKNIDAFHSIPDNSVEVMIYGSSHAWRGINNLEMYDKYGIGSYNYCGNWQCVSTEELFLRDSFRTQNPRVVLIETYFINHTLYDTDMTGEIYYTRRIPYYEGKKEYLYRAFGTNIGRYISYYLPFTQFHSRWNQINISSFIDYFCEEEFVNSMGYFCLPNDNWGRTSVQIGDVEAFTQIPLDEEAKMILDEIVAECEAKDIEVVFFTLPYQGEYLFADAMEEYARANDCSYLDFFKLLDDVGINCEEDFYDIEHLNYSGATKIANYFGDYLVSNYELSDMRKVEDNLWESKNGNITGKKWLKYNKKE